jgi:ketopantoate reductase
LLFNNCLNALGALTKMTYGELVSNANTRHLITHLADETIKVVQLERNLNLEARGVDYLNGAVVRMGASHGIATPYSDAISGLIRARQTDVNAA